MVPVFWEKKSSRVPWDKEVQGHTAERERDGPAIATCTWFSMEETVCGLLLEGTQKAVPGHLHPMPERKLPPVTSEKGQEMK